MPQRMSSGLEPVGGGDTRAENMVVRILGGSIILLAQYARKRSWVRHSAVRVPLHWFFCGEASHSDCESLGEGREG